MIRKRGAEIGNSRSHTTPADALVIFGLTGDLAHKMIFPALYAMAKRGAPFTREDAVEAAWAVVDPVLNAYHRTRRYKPGSRGPKQADTLIAADESWHNPIPVKAAK